ncbi:ABC transporter ATP-binding protein [soil metagenome]
MLTVTGLNASYCDSHILRGVSLALPAGTSLGLLGRNGMGKTTLIRTLMGYVRATSGSVRWSDGGEESKNASASAPGSTTRKTIHNIEREVTGWPPERMARLGIGYVPEGRGIFTNLSVRENLVMAARAGVHGQRGWTLERVLATFPRLAERLQHGGQQLSGGEQQMLAIGRALLTNPQLLILDEATEGLAPLIVAEIWRVVGEIRATGIATLIVDRNYRAVLAHTDRAVVLEKGLIVLEGASAALAQDDAALAAFLGV